MAHDLESFGDLFDRVGAHHVTAPLFPKQTLVVQYRKRRRTDLRKTPSRSATPPFG
jgi:hypothetical protein